MLHRKSGKEIRLCYFISINYHELLRVFITLRNSSCSFKIPTVVVLVLAYAQNFGCNGRLLGHNT